MIQNWQCFLFLTHTKLTLAIISQFHSLRNMSAHHVSQCSLNLIHSSTNQVHCPLAQHLTLTLTSQLSAKTYHTDLLLNSQTITRHPSSTSSTRLMQVKRTTALTNNTLSVIAVVSLGI